MFETYFGKLQKFWNSVTESTLRPIEDLAQQIAVDFLVAWGFDRTDALLGLDKKLLEKLKSVLGDHYSSYQNDTTKLERAAFRQEVVKVLLSSVKQIDQASLRDLKSKPCLIRTSANRKSKINKRIESDGKLQVGDYILAEKLMVTCPRIKIPRPSRLPSTIELHNIQGVRKMP